MILCCSFTWRTGCLDYFYCIRIFGWIITGTSTWIPTLISKYWICYWFSFCISDCNDTCNFSWEYSCIPTWIYLEYQLVVVLGLALGNSFDTSVVSLLWYLVDLALFTLIDRLVVPLLGNYMIRYLETFLVLTFYFYFGSPPRSLFDSESWYNVLRFIL